jgi:hypothetical protein
MILLELFATRADVQVILSIIGKIGTLEGSIFAAGFIYHRKMRGDPALLNPPIQHWP